MHDSNAKGAPPSVAAALIAGALSGAVAKTTIAPLDRTKINFQVSRTRRYSFKAALKFIRLTYQSEGFLALYRGNSATLARVVPYAAIQFAVHERAKYLLAVDVGAKTPGRRYVAGSLAGVCAVACTYPLDTAKARLSISPKTEYRGIVDVFVKVTKVDGIRSLYRGILPTLAGVIPYAGSSFWTFGTLKGLYRDEFGVDPSAPYVMAMGAAAGLVGQSSSYPLDIVRRRMQTGRCPPGLTILQLLVHIAKNEGIKRGLYKGLSMNWVKGPIATGVSFTTFNSVFPYLSSHLSGDSSTSPSFQ